MRISDWSSDVCSSDLYEFGRLNNAVRHRQIMLDAARDDMIAVEPAAEELLKELGDEHAYLSCTLLAQLMSARREIYHFHDMLKLERSEEHTSELKSLMRFSYAVFCLKKKHDTK